MKVFIATIFFVAACQATNLDLSQWSTFKIVHGKSYESESEELARKQIFLSNVRKIEQHNELYAQGLVSFQMLVNKFADMELHEFSSIYNGYRGSDSGLQASGGVRYIPPANTELPSAVNWVSQGAVTAVKNQGQCGSCWSFSSTGSLEGQHFRKTGKLVSFSEQNLIDCSSSYGNHGCIGGWMDQAFRYIKDNRGIDTEQSYPYEFKQGNCRFNPKNVGATVTGYVDIAYGNENDLKSASATVGPISVAIDAGHQSFQFYSNGIYYEPNCSISNLNHAVLVVGYGTENGKDYWLVKNSWGTSWGHKGYFKLARNRNNHCGVVSRASYPTV